MKTKPTLDGIAAALDTLLAPKEVRSIPASIESAPDIVIGPGAYGKGEVQTAKIKALHDLIAKDHPDIAAKFRNGVFIFDVGESTTLKHELCNEAMFTLGLIEATARRIPPVLADWMLRTDDLDGTAVLAGPNGSYFTGIGLQQAYGVVLRKVNALVEDTGRPGYGHDFGGAAALPT